MPLVTTHFIKSIALATYQTKSYLCLISAWLLNIYIIFCGCSFDTMSLKLPMNCCSLNMFSHHMIFWPVFNWLNIGFLLLSNLVKKKHEDLLGFILYTQVNLGNFHSSGLSSYRVNLSPFTKDYRGEGHLMSLNKFLNAERQTSLYYCSMFEYF